MQPALGPNIRVSEHILGEEKAALLVIDDFVADAEQLVEFAAHQNFAPAGQAFPGIRAPAPQAYMKLLLTSLQGIIFKYFNIKGSQLGLSMCHYSMVTTPPEKLSLVQRVPHIDATDTNGLASVHYLFKKELGGTAFYRHRSTGFEYIDDSRAKEYFAALERESADERFPGCRYINGDTPFFQQIAAQEGVFNRMLVYRRNSLHSGSIDEHFIPDSDPRTGRLSINSFIDVR